MNGVGSSAPFLITLSAPLCSVTKMRPSSATASAVGHVSPDATSASVNPEGTVAATTDPASTEVLTTSVSERASVNADRKAGVCLRDELFILSPLVN